MSNIIISVSADKINLPSGPMVLNIRGARKNRSNNRLLDCSRLSLLLMILERCDCGFGNADFGIYDGFPSHFIFLSI